jgi:hypothetical protein
VKTLTTPMTPDAEAVERLTKLASDAVRSAHIYEGTSSEASFRQRAADLHRAIAALSPPASPPEGWCLVPVEPTRTMLNAVPTRVFSGAKDVSEIYRAMLSASPKVGTQEEEKWPAGTARIVSEIGAAQAALTPDEKQHSCPDGPSQGGGRQTVTYGPCVSCGARTRNFYTDGHWRCSAVACMGPTPSREAAEDK